MWQLKAPVSNHKVGANPAAMHPAMQTPNPALQAMIAAGTPAPAVTVPNVNPAPA